MTLTDEQVEIISAGKHDEASLLINALAGSGKTSTLVLLAQRLPVLPTLSLGFNKRTADEMAKRLPSHIESKTLNAVGHRVWAAKTSRRLVVETDKMYSILSEMMERASGEDKKAFGEAFASILRACRLAKSSGYVPAEFSTLGRTLVTPAQYQETIAPQIDCEPDDYFQHKVDQALEISISQAFLGKIDFDDQIYMSTLFGGVYPKYPIVMVDEAQDLSPLNHESLSQMFGGRIIAVGDPYQSIYGFRGAHTSSMGLIGERFNCRELSLTCSFRCPQNVVRAAWFRVPQMTWAPDAPEGVVETLESWSTDSIPEGATVICRNNAPLFKLALRMIKKGRNVKMAKGDIGVSLIKLLKKIGAPKLLQEDLLSKITAWEESEISKSRESRHAQIHDRAACLRVFADAGPDFESAVAFAEVIFAGTGSVLFTTGHGAKGGEWDEVFFLESQLIPSKWAKESAEAGDNSQMEQELNLKYVITTRAKRRLVYIFFGDMQ